MVGKSIFHNSSFSETDDEVFVFDYLLRLAIPIADLDSKLELFGAVHNLTDVTYIYRNEFPQPSRWIEVGINCAF